jgi:phosphonopyruvate decarboxylase
MQNSGLGTSLNALASLSLMYGVPALLVVTWRGHEGNDAPEHLLMGDITPRLLDLLHIPSRRLGPGSLQADLAWAAGELDAAMTPVALLVPPGIVERGAARPEACEAAARRPTDEDHSGPSPAVLGPATMTRLTAVASALKAVGDAPVVHANGYICRESFFVADRPQSFYMVGSMGLAPAIALGVALARPERPVVVFDGDGNLLMNLGILTMIAARRPENFLHVVFDNEVYGSTGNQASPSRDVRLDRVAAAAGFAGAVAVTTPFALEAAVRDALAAPGPRFVLVKVTAEEADVPRIPHTPVTMRDRFRAAIGG